MRATARVRGFIDTTFRVRGGLRLRLCERPGAWMDDPALDDLVAALRRVADRSVAGRPLRYGMLGGAREDLARALVLVMVDPTGRPVGFNAMALLDVPVGGRMRRVLHSGLCILSPEHRSRRLSVALYALPAVLAFARNRGRALWVTNVSQVPAALGMFADGLDAVYPAPGLSRPPSPHHVEVAQGVVDRFRPVFGVGAEARFDPATFVLENAYTGGSDALGKTLAQCPGHRDPRFRSLCRKRLDYGRGDDFVQVGRLSAGSALRLGLRFLRHAVAGGTRSPGARALLGHPRAGAVR